MKTIFTILILAVASFGQTVVNVPALTVSADGVAAIQSWMLTQNTGITTTLNGALTIGATSLTLQDATGIGNNDVVLIDGEALTLSAKSGRTFTCTRADLGTTATTHADKAGVNQLKYATIRLLFRQLIVDTVARLMDTANYPTAATQNAIINTAKAAKDAAKASAIQ